MKKINSKSALALLIGVSLNAGSAAAVSFPSVPIPGLPGWDQGTFITNAWQITSQNATRSVHTIGALIVLDTKVDDIIEDIENLDLGNINIDFTTVTDKITTLESKITDLNLNVGEIPGLVTKVSDQAIAMGLLKNEITAATDVARISQDLLADPSLKNALEIISEDGGEFVNKLNSIADDADRLQTLVNNVNIVSEQLPDNIDTDISNALLLAKDSIVLAENQMRLASSNPASHPNLVNLLNGMTRLMNEMKDGLGPDVNIDAFTGLMAILPPQAIEAIGYGLLTAGIDNGFISRLDEVVQAVPQLKRVIVADTSFSGVAGGIAADVRDSDVLKCSEMYRDRLYLNALATTTSITGASLKVIGGYVNSLSETVATGYFANQKMEAGVHGYAALDIKNDNYKMAGLIIDGIGDGLLGLADAASGTIRHCEYIVNNRTVQQRFVDVVGDDAWVPGQPLNPMHTLAGIGDNITSTSVNLRLLDEKVTTANTTLGVISSDITLANTSLSVIITATENANATLGIISNDVTTANTTLGVINNDVVAANATLAKILANTDKIPAIGSEITGINSTVESNSDVLAYIAERIDSIPSLKRSGTGQNSTGASVTETKGKQTVYASTTDVITDVATNDDATVDFQKLMLRISIEESLSSDQSKGIAIYYRPTERGGQLEFVREIVNDTIQQNLDGGYTVGTALSYLDEGDVHFASGYYKEAWEAFGHAYREAL